MKQQERILADNMTEDGYFCRLDFVRGFHGSHVRDYMLATSPTFAVGEFWVGHYAISPVLSLHQSLKNNSPVKLQNGILIDETLVASRIPFLTTAAFLSTTRYLSAQYYGPRLS